MLHPTDRLCPVCHSKLSSLRQAGTKATATCTRCKATFWPPGKAPVCPACSKAVLTTILRGDKILMVHSIRVADSHAEPEYGGCVCGIPGFSS
jgi:RNA polymerase subunit RPABC4/transcription elongation factor Spt4